ncbi:MAG: alpha-mannosidase [Phycisphaerae bacterium]|nr:alpha-mannosidase [Phycisphaerae bacterium]
MNPVNLHAVVRQTTQQCQHLVERADAQLKFAGQLCQLFPNHAATWQPLIQKAQAHLMPAVQTGQPETIAAAVTAIEKLLEPMAKTAKSYTIHSVGHAHIDMNWMWSWPETVAIIVDTFTTVLKLMDQYPDFKLSQSQASTYAVIEEHRPDMLTQIARRVQEGRWEVTASHWVEGDKNLASGESLCRHLLYTREYMQRLFNLRPEDVPIDWAPDTFGHAASVPTYLTRGAVKYLYLHRPGVHTVQKPGAFWWQGPDGSRVLVRNDMEQGYNGQITPGFMGQFLKFVQLTGGRDFMIVYGVGDHGGGPTRRDIVRAIDMNTWPIFPAVQFSTARAFFQQLEKQGDKLPVIHGELNTEFTGCYTTQTLIKKANRLAENRLLDAELASVLADLIDGQAGPGVALLQAWRDTLFSQFHDILPGSGVHDTRTYTHGLFQKTMATTSQAELRAWRHLATLINTSHNDADTTALRIPPSSLTDGLGAGVGFQAGEGHLPLSEQSCGSGPRPLVLFNPTSHARSEVVEAVIWDNAPVGDLGLKSKSFSVRGPNGRHLAAQVVKTGAYWGHEFVTLAFPATVPGLGYAQYTITEASAEPPMPLARQIGMVHHCPYAIAERSIEGLESDLLRVEIDTTTGAILSLVDKVSGHAVIDQKPGAATLEYAVERPHGMTAWCIDHTGPVEIPAVTAVRRGLTGPYKATIEVDWQVRESTGTLVYEVRTGDPKLYLHWSAVWFQRGTPQTGVPTLRLAFPLAIEKPVARYEIPFGAVDRPLHHGEEVPALQWASVRGQCGKGLGGCLLLNDCKYGHSLTANTLRLTLIRSSYDPDILPEIGQHEAHVALQPFLGDMPVARAVTIGREFNHTIRIIGTDVHEGTLPQVGTFLEVQPETLVLSCIKKAQAGDAVIVRLFNPTDKPQAARIQCPADLLGQVKQVQEVDLLERPVEKSTLAHSNNTLQVEIPAHAITTLKIALV